MTYSNETYSRNTQSLITVNTTSQATSNTAGVYTTINGSEITYTPAINSNSVVYEIGFYAEAINKTCFQHIALEHNTGSWSQVSVKFGRNFGANDNQYFRDYLNFRYVIPSWTGSRQLRLRSGSHITNYSVSYHQITEWDGSGSVSNRFCNTSLLVYSI